MHPVDRFRVADQVAIHSITLLRLIFQCIENRHITPALEPGHHRILRSQDATQSYRIQSRLPLPRPSEALRREQAGTPPDTMIGTAVEGHPLAVHGIGKDRMAPGDPLPFGITFQDAFRIHPWPMDSLPAFGAGDGAPDPAKVPGSKGDVKNIPPALLLVVNRRRRPQRTADFLGILAGAGFEHRVAASPCLAVRTRPVCQHHLVMHGVGHHFGGEQVVDPFELEHAAAFKAVLVMLGARHPLGDHRFLHCFDDAQGDATRRFFLSELGKLTVLRPRHPTD